jgi:hypothetical protein
VIRIKMMVSFLSKMAVRAPTVETYRGLDDSMTPHV